MRSLRSAALATGILVVAIGALIVTGMNHAAHPSQARCTSSPQASQDHTGGLFSGPGSEPQTPRPFVSRSPVPVPSVFNGHLALAWQNNDQTVSVSRGTIIDLTLTNGPWQLPTASSGLTRLSADETCDYAAQASFKAIDSGVITAERDSREAIYLYSVTVIVDR